MKNKDFVNAPEDYRAEDLTQDIMQLITRARVRGHVVTKERIDEIIRYLKDDPDRCKAFIGWRYLGTHNYYQVFSKEADQNFKINKLLKEAAELRATIEDLNKTIKELSQQLEAARIIPAEMSLNSGDQLYRLM